MQKELDQVGRLLGVVVVAIAVLMVGIILFVEDVNGFSAIFDALILGVALAVAAVPEGSPTIVTAVRQDRDAHQKRDDRVHTCLGGRRPRQQCRAAGARRALDRAGDPTEGALIVAARKARLEPDALEARFERIGEIPFSSERKLMSTVHVDAEKEQVLRAFTKASR